MSTETNEEIFQPTYGWKPLSEVIPEPPKDSLRDKSPVWNTILMYYPSRDHFDFPGHSVDVSNREYVRKHKDKLIEEGVMWAEIEDPLNPTPKRLVMSPSDPDADKWADGIVNKLTQNSEKEIL